jgi:site-specific recombinase XerD
MSASIRSDTDREWRQALADCGDELAASDRSSATCKAYLLHLEWLAADVPNWGPWELRTSELTEWRDGHNWSVETRRKVLVSLHAFYAWAVAERRCEWAPTAGIPSLAPQKRGPARKQIRNPAWREPVAEFLRWCEAGARTPLTIRAYRWRLTALSEQSADPWALTMEQLSAWVANPDWKPEMKKSVIVAVRTFYKWAVRTGRADSSPCDGLASVRIPRTLPRPTPRDVLASALMLADDRQRECCIKPSQRGSAGRFPV